MLSNYRNKHAIAVFVREDSAQVLCVLFNYLPDNSVCFTFSLCSPQNEDASFHFDGSGYSVVEKTLRATVTQIIMLFSTFSPNGLLLYLASNGTVRVFMGHWAPLRVCSWITMRMSMFNDSSMSLYLYNMHRYMPRYFPILGYFLIFAFLGPYPQHMEIPRLGI